MVALSQLLSLVVFLLSGRKVHIISKVLFTFGIGEVLLFVAMGIALLSKSTLSVEMLDSMVHPANFSFSAFGTAALFGVLMFVGFESGIPFSEETKNAASSYVKAVWLSTVLTGAMFLLSYFALVAACYKGGPLSDISLSDLAALPSPFFDKLAPSVCGDFGRLFLFLVLLISTISSGLASFGAGSRNLFAFARFGVLPQSIARTCSTTGVPRGGNSACYLLTVVMGLALACINDPKLAFEYSATTFGTADS